MKKVVSSQVRLPSVGVSNPNFSLFQLKQRVDTFQCETCRRNKYTGLAYGQLPPRQAIMIPGEELHIDLIEPWRVRVGQQEIEYLALTCIDPVTNLAESIRLENKSAHLAQQFQNRWLSRYLWPRKCVHDNGEEFIGFE